MVIWSFIMYHQEETCICALFSFDRYVEIRRLINIDTELLSFGDEKISSCMCLRARYINNFACWSIVLFLVIYQWISVMIIENTQTFTEIYVNKFILIHILSPFEIVGKAYISRYFKFRDKYSMTVHNDLLEKRVTNCSVLSFFRQSPFNFYLMVKSILHCLLPAIFRVEGKFSTRNNTTTQQSQNPNRYRHPICSSHIHSLSNPSIVTIVRFATVICLLTSLSGASTNS